MALKDIFQNQADQLRAFLDGKRRSMCIVQHDPDLKPVVQRIFAGLDNDDGCPHIIWGTGTAFHNRTQYFRDVLKELIDANENHRSELAALGIELTPPSYEKGWAATRGQFVEYISSVADSLPDLVGSFAIVIDPQTVDDLQDYQESIHFLANNTESKRVKYFVLDQRSKPLLKDINRYSDRISIQVFRFSAEEVERHVRDDLDNNKSLSPAERRQYTAMMGAFAFTRKDYGEAERRQRDVLNKSLKSGDSGEQAIAYYNLGNTYLSAKKPELAEECYTRAGELCLDTGSAPLLAIILTNLGIALSDRGHINEAVDSFDTACLTFQGVNNHTGAAYSLDCKASMLAKAGQKREAEEAWLRALDIYDSIEGEALSDARESGRKDILEKLDRLGRWPNKIRYV
jgi:tetratricopeptide (TPR) repeat protein